MGGGVEPPEAIPPPPPPQLARAKVVARKSDWTVKVFIIASTMRAVVSLRSDEGALGLVVLTVDR